MSVEQVKFEPRRVAIGDRVQLSFVLRSQSRARQDVLVDLAVHFVKAGGRTAPKVFKLKRLQLPPGGRVELQSRISLAVHTTRVPRPGRHAVDVLVNGQARRVGSFEVISWRCPGRQGVTYSGGLARVVVALVLALFMVQALGTASAAPEPCAQQCEDDGPDGQCAPDCEDCVCCVHARVAVTGPALTRAADRRSVATGWRGPRPARPSPWLRTSGASRSCAPPDHVHSACLARPPGSIARAAGSWPPCAVRAVVRPYPEDPMLRTCLLRVHCSPSFGGPALAAGGLTLTLDAALELARARGPAAQAARMAVAEAQGQLAGARRLADNPTLAGGLGRRLGVGTGAERIEGAGGAGAAAGPGGQARRPDRGGRGGGAGRDGRRRSGAAGAGVRGGGGVLPAADRAASS